MNEKAFELGKTYEHTTGKRMHIVGSACSLVFGYCLIGETAEGKLVPVGASPDSAQNWKESDGRGIDIAFLLDSLEAAWGLIANAEGGVWPDESEWTEAAIRWRDQRWHPILNAITGTDSDSRVGRPQ